MNSVRCSRTLRNWPGHRIPLLEGDPVPNVVLTLSAAQRANHGAIVLTFVENTLGERSVAPVLSSQDRRRARAYRGVLWRLVQAQSSGP